jgi:hypothetical protein
MKFRAVVVPAEPRSPKPTKHGTMQVESNQQSFAVTRESIRRAVDALLAHPDTQAGDRVDVYLITETLVESFTKEKDA